MSRIVDAHVHLWPSPLRPGEVPLQPPGNPFPDHLDANAETLLAEMDRHGIARSIVVQSPWFAHDDRYLMEVADRWPDRFTNVACFPLALAEADLAHEAARVGQDGMQGVRVHVIGPDALAVFGGAGLDPLYRRLSDAGLPVLFLSRNALAHDRYGAIAEAFPDLKIVIEHMGFATTPPFGGTPESARNFMRLAARPNIFVKLAVHHQHSQTDYPWTDLHPLQHRFIAEFGANRLMWGSNWPMRPEEVTVDQRIEVMTRHFPFKSEDDRAWILGRTAESLWPQPALAAAS